MNNKPRSRNPETSKLTFPLFLTEKLRRATMIKRAHGACGAKYKTIKRKSKPCAGARREKMKLTKKRSAIDTGGERSNFRKLRRDKGNAYGGRSRQVQKRQIVRRRKRVFHSRSMRRTGGAGHRHYAGRTPIRHHSRRCGQTGRKTCCHPAETAVRYLPTMRRIAKLFCKRKRARRSCRCPSYCPTNTFRANKNANAPLSFWERRFLLPAILQIKE